MEKKVLEAGYRNVCHIPQIHAAGPPTHLSVSSQLAESEYSVPFPNAALPGQDRVSMKYQKDITEQRSWTCFGAFSILMTG
jgi:hypothetical protein